MLMKNPLRCKEGWKVIFKGIFEPLFGTKIINA
jgi:hypothetical protein